MDAPTAARARVLYVHVPFCANHCLFCGFYRHRYEEQEAASYAEALLQELAGERGRERASCAPIQAIYLGGGTPSALGAKDLARLVEGLRRWFPLANDCEITLEGRVLHFDDEKADACLEAGVNRISIGVQSFDTEVRRRQGRRASGEEVQRFVERLRDRGRAAVVLDLIFGLPGQTDAIWRKDLETAIALEPDGIDLYALGVFPGTPLFTATQKGVGTPPRPLREQGAMYGAGLDVLLGAGWRQLSNSHLARDTRERNRYNLLIKQGAETLAYGAGAGGALGPYTFQMHGDLGAYHAQLAAGRKPIETMFEADALQPACDFVRGGLDQGGLDLARLMARLGRSQPDDALARLLEQWQRVGLVERRGGWLHLTMAGRFWSTNLSAGVCASVRAAHLASHETTAACPAL